MQLATFRPAAMTDRPAFRPARRSMLSQLVEVRPEVEAPITVGLGSLPMTIGSFAGSALFIWIGANNPSIRTFTTIGALGLAGFGIFNLLAGEQVFGAETVPGGAETPGTVSHSGGADTSASVPIAPTDEDAFQALSGRVIRPTEWQTLPLGAFDSTVSIRVRLTNPTDQPITFDLVFTAQELPEPFGGEQVNTTSSRVSLGAGETRDVDIPLTLLAWEWHVDTVDVYLRVEKRRTRGGAPALLDLRAFQVD